MLLSGAGAWQAQTWRYEKRLSDSARTYQADLNTLTLAANSQLRSEQAQRVELEQRQSGSEQRYYRDLSNAQKNQARLRDRLATTDVRLSALLDAKSAARCGPMPTEPVAGSVDYGTQRAQLDPAHAQRIISITDDGDQGLIALGACQAYITQLTATE
ncbi:lysis system i-spanin subunit Rz [Pseudomonas sp. GXZC]|uniref:lysis system i-spanin subunit Rz n=1 Tax=Pseudomonas sp. GXZC TaxID=3003351 RepID=UPI0022AA5DBB|nr:lysis system i-spanin subunit Rz [Pseudomonas sp. GXZC]WAT31951.1 lysis system i-spanin subunit Rz [Pseudomonas sp. GXZC]